MDFIRLSRLQRINVVGTSGSGKSTFARNLAEILNLPCCEMDRLYWKPSWKSCEDDELFQRVHDVTSQPSWILDGNYTRTIPIKWNRVQLVVWLDISFARTFARVTHRCFRRAVSQQELHPGTGNCESFARSFFSLDSVILWSIRTHGQNRRKYVELMESPEYSHIEFLRLSSPGAVESCLEGFRSAVANTQRSVDGEP